MPRIARTFIKTGLIYFLCALLLGLSIEISGDPFSSDAAAFLAPAYARVDFPNYLWRIHVDVSRPHQRGRFRSSKMGMDKYKAFINRGIF